MPVKNRRGLETRLRVIHVAKYLIGEQGYAEVTLDQISAAAGVAKSSLLWHFGSKEMLLSEAVSSLFQEIEADLQFGDLHALNVEQRVTEVFDRVACYLTANPEAKGVVLALLFSSTTPEKVRAHIRATWEGHVQALVDLLGTPQRPVPPAMARTLVALFQGSYCHWYANGRDEPIADYLAPGRELFFSWLRDTSAGIGGYLGTSSS